jgi:putative tricarboxylic transport membrane protein
MQNENEGPAEPGLVSYRTMEIVVALVLLAGSALVIFDSVRIGSGWEEGSGPAPGYFPFYMALFLAIAAAVNFFVSAISREDDGGVFITRRAFGSVLSILLPTIAFVAAIQWLGIYVSAALFIGGFMIALGKEPIWRALLVGAGIPLVLFLMFERWFLVPLPKGFLEAALGF